MLNARAALLALSVVSLAGTCTAFAGEQLIPAGSLIQCMIGEPKLSSKTADVGDPVLCRVTHVESYGHTLPYGTVLVGRFEDYKDPGHLVGKGWMELKFERMVVHDEVVPLEAKVVSVPGYNVDKQGRILGKGHPVRDVVEWSIPILWPIDLINLPRRGPRPTLKGETRLTLKVMDDIAVPVPQQQQAQQGGLVQRAPAAYVAPTVVEVPAVQQSYPEPVAAAAPPAYPAPSAYAPGYSAPMVGQTADGRAIYGPYAAPGVGEPVLVYRNGVAYRTIVR